MFLIPIHRWADLVIAKTFSRMVKMRVIQKPRVLKMTLIISMKMTMTM